MENRFKDFTLLISNISRAINKIKNQEMRKFGLKGTQVNCLFYLYENKTGMTAKDICSLCKEDKGAVSRTLRELEELGYIVCKRDDNKKKYNSVLSLTSKGTEIAEYISDKISQIINYDKNYISSDELAEFYKTFKKIYQNLKKVSESCGGEND
ncbi:MAG: MarR family winged helix-turn-helix transcriptional regulator [Christensenellales bacterium]